MRLDETHQQVGQVKLKTNTNMLTHIDKQVNKLWQLAGQTDISQCDPELYAICKALDKCIDKLSGICMQ
jgi:hypothetical protein